MGEPRPNKNVSSPDRHSEKVKVTAGEQPQEILINDAVCVPDDRPAGPSAPVTALASQFRPIHLLPSTSTDSEQKCRITPQPIYPLKKRHFVAPAPPVNNNNVTVATAGRWATSSSPCDVNMDVASERFALEYAREQPLAILPISCGNTCAAIYLELFVSGSIGCCIKYKNRWLTPVEFEDLCESSYLIDWQRSIKYGGHDLQILINADIIKIQDYIGLPDNNVPDRPSGTPPPQQPLELTTEHKRKDRDPEPEWSCKKQRLCVPDELDWQTAANHFERMESDLRLSTSLQLNLPSNNADTKAYQQNAINYSTDSASYRAPSSLNQSIASSQTATSFQNSNPSSSFQNSSNSFIDPSMLYQNRFGSPLSSSNSYQRPNQNRTGFYQNQTSSYQNSQSSSAYPHSSYQSPQSSLQQESTSYRNLASQYLNAPTPFQSSNTLYNLPISPAASYQTPAYSYQTATSSYQDSNSSYQAPMQTAQSRVQSSLPRFPNSVSLPNPEPHIPYWRDTYEIAGSATPASELVESQLSNRSRDAYNIQVANPRKRPRSPGNRRDTTLESRPITSSGPGYNQLPTTCTITNPAGVRTASRGSSQSSQPRNDLGCMLCTETMFFGSNCPRDCHVVHAPCCLQDIVPEQIWTPEHAARLFPAHLGTVLFQDHQVPVAPPNPRGIMTARQEFLVSPFEYMPAPGEEVEFETSVSFDDFNY